MFDLVAKHKRIAQVILFLIMVPFAFFGVDYYFRGGGEEGTVATVGGEKITQNEFADAVREQTEQMRRQMGKNFDPRMFDNPEVRFALLDNLINQRCSRTRRARRSSACPMRSCAVHQRRSRRSRTTASSRRPLPDVARVAEHDPAVLRAAKLRQDLLTGAVQEPIAAPNIVARPSAPKFLSLLEQQREVAVAPIDLEPFLKDVKVDEAQLKDFYDKNPTAFQVPEQARIEYVLLTQDALIAQATVDAGEVKKQYEANATQYTAPEERSASHILIPVKPDAKDDEKAAAKKLADDVYAKAKANPAKFADLAKEYSKDPGSAQQGGDLGSFGRGAMVKPFEDAVFAAKPGDLLRARAVGLRLARHQGDRRPAVAHAALRGSARADRGRAQEAEGRAEVRDRRRPVPEPGLRAGRQPERRRQGARPQGRDDAVRHALRRRRRSGSAIPSSSRRCSRRSRSQSKRNTEAIEVAPNSLIAGRIVEYKAGRAAAVRGSEGRDPHPARRARRRASSRRRPGRRSSKLLEAGKSDKEAGVAFGKPSMVGRGQFQAGLPPDVLNRVFAANADKLPAYTGATNERGGYSIVRVMKVVTPEDTDKARVDMAANRLSDQLGREVLNAYLASLKAKADVKINQANLDKTLDERLRRAPQRASVDRALASTRGFRVSRRRRVPVQFCLNPRLELGPLLAALASST